MDCQERPAQNVLTLMFHPHKYQARSRLRNKRNKRFQRRKPCVPLQENQLAAHKEHTKKASPSQIQEKDYTRLSVTMFMGDVCVPSFPESTR